VRHWPNQGSVGNRDAKNLIAQAEAARADAQIPECEELLSHARAEYRSEADQSYKTATTLQDRLNNQGCWITKQVGHCEAMKTSFKY